MLLLPCCMLLSKPPVQNCSGKRSASSSAYGKYQAVSRVPTACPLSVRACKRIGIEVGDAMGQRHRRGEAR